MTGNLGPEATGSAGPIPMPLSYWLTIIQHESNSQLNLNLKMKLVWKSRHAASYISPHEQLLSFAMDLAAFCVIYMLS